MHLCQCKKSSLWDWNLSSTSAHLPVPGMGTETAVTQVLEWPFLEACRWCPWFSHWGRPPRQRKEAFCTTKGFRLFKIMFELYNWSWLMLMTTPLDIYSSCSPRFKGFSLIFINSLEVMVVHQSSSDWFGFTNRFFLPTAPGLFWSQSSLLM